MLTTKCVNGKGVAMRAYNVDIVAEDAAGNKVEFVWPVVYPKATQDSIGRVCETFRERRAVAQVRKQMPHLRNVRATGSRHV